jgi:hypothetical protein
MKLIVAEWSNKKKTPQQGRKNNTPVEKAR